MALGRDLRAVKRDRRKIWGISVQGGYLRVCFLTEGGRVAWIVRLVKTGAGREGQATDVMEIQRPDDLRNVAGLDLTLSETKQLLGPTQHSRCEVQSKLPA